VRSTGTIPTSANGLEPVQVQQHDVVTTGRDLSTVVQSSHSVAPPTNTAPSAEGNQSVPANRSPALLARRRQILSWPSASTLRLSRAVHEALARWWSCAACTTTPAWIHGHRRVRTGRQPAGTPPATAHTAVTTECIPPSRALSGCVLGGGVRV
jgi:hypothetical protein